jgi:hypothetical protein
MIIYCFILFNSKEKDYIETSPIIFCKQFLIWIGSFHSILLKNLSNHQITLFNLSSTYENSFFNPITFLNTTDIFFHVGNEKKNEESTCLSSEIKSELKFSLYQITKGLLLLLSTVLVIALDGNYL